MRPRGWSLRRRVAVVMVVVLAAAQAAALLWMDHRLGPRPLWGDEAMHWDIAQRWAAGQPAILEPLWPPLYPALLAAVITAGGSRAAVGVMQLAMLGAAAWLLFQTVRRLLDDRAATVAAAFFVLDPQLVAFAMYLWPEIPHVLLVMAATWIVVARPVGHGWSAALGAVLGAALLTKNLLGPLLPLGAVWLGLRGRVGIVRVSVAFIALLAVTAPTMLENRRLHGAAFVGDSARFNAWVGLNDTGRRGLVTEIVGAELERYRDSGVRHADRNRVLGAKIRALVAERGVWRLVWAQLGRQYFRLFDRDSFFTDQLPGSVIAEPGFGYEGFGSGPSAAARVWAYGLYAVVLLLAPFGVQVVWRRNRAVAAALLAYVAFILVVCLVAHVKSRYRIPIMPVLYVLAAAAVTRHQGGPALAAVGRARARGATCLSAVAAALLLFLAFGREVVP